MENIVINLLCAFLDEILGFLIVSHEDQVPEGFGHKELLQHGNHVTDAA
jgi:hypothetical protein